MSPAQTKRDAPGVFFTDSTNGASGHRRSAGPSPLPDDPHELIAAAYDQHADELFRHALMLTADHGLAEDALQQAFLKLARMGSRILKIESCGHYLRAAVRNECWRLLQRRRRRRREVELTAVGGTGRYRHRGRRSAVPA